ncbi:hypothetical protein ONZ45_g7729 [Pleurotus djamor]|nr:hypothetical protein ONZ45_g7729 [Pleurotus djamor]
MKDLASTAIAWGKLASYKFNPLTDGLPSSFSASQITREHLKVALPSQLTPKMPSYTCEHCKTGVKYASMEAILQHYIVKQHGHVCIPCHKVFATDQSLYDHLAKSSNHDGIVKLAIASGNTGLQEKSGASSVDTDKTDTMSAADATGTEVEDTKADRDWVVVGDACV